MQIGPNQGRKIRSFYKGRYQPGSGFKASAAHLNPKFPWNERGETAGLVTQVRTVK